MPFAADKKATITYQLKDGEKTTVEIPGTGDVKKFTPIELGILKIDAPGVYELEIRATGGNSWNPIRLRAVEVVQES